MIQNITFEHTVPLAVLAAGIALAVLALPLAIRRWPGFSGFQAGLAAIRLLFLALLAWCLLMPVAREDEREMLKPRFLVALDTSGSMTNTPAPEIPSRHETARRLLGQEWVRTIASQATLDIYPFDTEPGPALTPAQALARRAEGTGTALRETLARLADRHRGQDVAGLLLLSDGLDTREASTLWTRQAWPFPLYTVRLEPPVPWTVTPDVRVDGIDTPRRVTVGWSSELKASISGEGAAGRMLTVRLFREGALVQELPTQLPDGGGARELVFPLQHEAVGLYTFEVRVDPLPGEIQTNDNHFAATVQVMDTRNQLLYIEGLPRWESKYLMRALRAIADITPLAFIRGPDGRFVTYGERGGATLDLTDAQLAPFRIVILGDLDAPGLGPGRDAALLKFVEKGGSLVLLGGPLSWGANGLSATALDRLLPVRRPGAGVEGRYPLAASAEGLAHPAFAADADWLAKLPPVLSLFPGGQPSAGASVLISAQTDTGLHPMIVFQRYGEGKVIAILTDSLWRWQLDRADTADSYFRFWNQTLNWLLPAESEAAPFQLDLFSDAEQLHLGDPLALHARFTALSLTETPPDSLTCDILTPDGRRIPFAMPRQTVTADSIRRYAAYTLRFQPESPGLHRAVARTRVQGAPLESAAYSFFVKPFTPESLPKPPDHDVLRALAAASGGRFLEPEQVADALLALDFRPREEALVRFSTLWNLALLLACLIGLLALEWILRKWRGLA